MPETETQAADNFTPRAQFTIETLDQLKIFADPLRQKIVEALLFSARTVKQVSRELDLAPTKLYYHFNLLEENGFITVTDTRVVSGIIEKHYRASAEGFAIRRELLSPGGAPDALDMAIDALINPLREEIHRGMNSGIIDTSSDAPNPRKMRAWREGSRLTEAQAAAFYERLEALLLEFRQLDAPPAQDEPRLKYQMVVSVYPVSWAEPDAE